MWVIVVAPTLLPLWVNFSMLLLTFTEKNAKMFQGQMFRVSDNMEKYPRGRRGSPAKGVGVSKAREGSNPSFSATIRPKTVAVQRFWRVLDSLAKAPDNNCCRVFTYVAIKIF